MSQTMGTKDKIYARLKKELSPQYLHIVDESTRHAGHSEAKTSGGGHYEVIIVSTRFQKMTLLRRHRMIYKSLRDNLLQKEIHALKIQAFTPQEWKEKPS